MDKIGEEASVEDEEVATEMMMPPMPRAEESPEIGIIKQLDPIKTLEQVKMNIKGYDWDRESEKWVKTRDPLMNDNGINKYMSILSSVICGLNTFSAYDSKEIGVLVRYVCEKAIPTIHINWKEYGIKSKSDLQILDIQIFNLANAAFHKALGAGDRNVIRGTVQENMSQRAAFMQNPGMMPQQKKKGVFSRLNPFS